LPRPFHLFHLPVIKLARTLLYLYCVMKARKTKTKKRLFSMNRNQAETKLAVSEVFMGRIWKSPEPAYAGRRQAEVY